MANTASQRSRNRRSEREHLENLRHTSAVKTHFKRLEDAIAAGDDSSIQSEHKLLTSRIDKAIQKGALHQRNGARKKSRAARAVAARN